jgi:osmotically inducible lipoprotein OsmB
LNFYGGFGVSSPETRRIHMTMRRNMIITGALCAVLALPACGTSKTDRALSGAGIGAGVGAVGSSLTGGNAATGALVGGAVGAAAGGLTDKDDINLGKPWWKR